MAAGRPQDISAARADFALETAGDQDHRGLPAGRSDQDG